MLPVVGSRVARPARCLPGSGLRPQGWRQAPLGQRCWADADAPSCSGRSPTPAAPQHPRVSRSWQFRGSPCRPRTQGKGSVPRDCPSFCASQKSRSSPVVLTTVETRDALDPSPP